MALNQTEQQILSALQGGSAELRAAASKVVGFAHRFTWFIAVACLGVGFAAGKLL